MGARVARPKDEFLTRKEDEMANDYRDRDRDRERERWREQNRGMFGYEGEGYLRGGDASRGRARGDFGSPYPVGEYNEPGYGRFGGYHGETFSGDSRTPERQSYRGRGPKGYQRSDERIREDICERLTFDDDVDATDLEVTVSGATVTLAGSVRDRYSKRRAEDIAESVAGVEDVQNQIRLAREE